MRSLYVRIVLCVCVMAYGTLLSAQSGVPLNYLYGIHTWSSGANGKFSGKRGWTCESVNTANYVFDLQPSQAQSIVNENLELIIRINKEAGLTVPNNPADDAAFVAGVVSKVNDFKNYCHIWIIGNEMNASFEGNIPVARYVSVYLQCRSAIKAVQPEAIVAVAGLAPWNASQTGVGPYPANRQWLNYLHDLMNQLGTNADAYVIHAYGGRGGDSDPRNDDEMAFGVFKRWMEVLDTHSWAQNVPVYLTEFNHAADGQGSTPGFPLYNYPAGFIQKAFEAVNTWNLTNNYQIRCACWFAYSNGGFPGYNITNNSTMASDFQDATQNTSYAAEFNAARDWELFD